MRVAGSDHGPDRLVLVALIGLFALALSEAAWAQEPAAEDVDRTRLGFHIGSGYASISTSEDTGVFGETTSTPDDMTVGLAFALDFGYLTRRNTYLEILMSFWTGTLDGALGGEEWSVGIFGGGVRWYPTGDGLYLRGGFGGGWIGATLKDSENARETDYDDYGLGLLGGVGFDLPVTEHFVAGPRIDVMFADVGDDVRALGFNLLFAFSWI